MGACCPSTEKVKAGIPGQPDLVSEQKQKGVSPVIGCAIHHDPVCVLVRACTRFQLFTGHTLHLLVLSLYFSDIAQIIFKS